MCTVYGVLWTGNYTAQLVNIVYVCYQFLTEGLDSHSHDYPNLRPPGRRETSIHTAALCVSFLFFSVPTLHLRSVVQTKRSILSCILYTVGVELCTVL